jgi:hypothetical protein
MLKKFIHLGIAVIVAGLFAGSAVANSVTAKFTSVSPSVAFKFTGTTSGHVYAGQINWTGATGMPDNTAGTAFSTFCIEPAQPIHTGNTYKFDVVDLASSIGINKATEIGYLWVDRQAEIGTDATKTAAFQIAIWEILSDSVYNLTDGNFKATVTPTPAAASLAQTWLAGLTRTGPLPTMLALKSATYQDQVFFAPPPENSPPVVPLPAAAWAGLVLMGVMGARKAIRNRRD